MLLRAQMSLGTLLVCAALAAQSPPDLKDAKLVAEGQQVFVKNCSVAYCHGKEGTTGRAPALRDRAWTVKELRESISNGVPNSSMPNWDDKLSDRQIWAVTAYILSIASETAPTAGTAPPAAVPSSPPAPASSDLPESLVGSAARGEEIFFQQGERGCAACHTIDGKGNAVGPDLSGSSRREARDLLRAIVLPRPDPARPLLAITMNDGEKILGIKQEETAAALRVFDLGGLPPALRRLPKDRIQSAQPERRPAMPSRYGEMYTLRQLLDIVSYLKSSGAAAPARVTFLDIQ
jgi:putative heme-binding domain-containing protein